MKNQSVVKRIRSYLEKESCGRSTLKVSRSKSEGNLGKYQLLSGNTVQDADDDVIALEKRICITEKEREATYRKLLRQAKRRGW